MALLHPAPGFKTGDKFGARPSFTANGIKTGSMHGGLDLVPIVGQSRTVVAAAAGVLVASPYGENAGIAACIRHEGIKGVEATGYAHLVLRMLPVGAHVEAGQPIGIAGSSGASTGVHLHFDVFADLDTFTRIDPYPLIDWSDPMSWTTKEKDEALALLRALRAEQVEEDGIAQRTLGAASEARDALVKPSALTGRFRPIDFLVSHVQATLNRTPKG